MDQDAEQKNSYNKRPLWQWVIIYLIIAAVVYGVLYYFVLAKKGYNNQTGQSAPTTPQQQTTNTPTIAKNTPSATTTISQQENTVTLTSSGFSPKSLTIKAGQTVTWINKSGQDATVNSDPHPVHTAYPPLNLGGFSDGASLSLTFPKTGTYGYHNHLNPSETGTIIAQ